MPPGGAPPRVASHLWPPPPPGAGACTGGPRASGSFRPTLTSLRAPPPRWPPRYRSWRERLHVEEATGVGFDRAWSEEAGFAFQFRSQAAAGKPERACGQDSAVRCRRHADAHC